MRFNNTDTMGYYSNTLKEYTMNCSITSHVFVLEGTYHYSMVGAIVVMSLLSIPIVFMNLLITIVIYKTPALHTPSNVLLLITAMFDLLVGLMSIPLYAAHLSLVNFLHRHDCILAEASWILLHTMTNMSFIMISVVSIDRYIAIYHPYYYEEKATVNIRRYIYISSVLGVSMLVFPSVCVLFGDGGTVVVQELSLYIVCVLGGVAVHTKIYLTVRTINMSISSLEMEYKASARTCERQRLCNAKRERKVALMTSLMLVSLVLFHLPYGVIGALWITMPPNSNIVHSIMIQWSYIFLTLKSLTNPLIYSYTLANIRKKVKDMITKLRMLPGKKLSTWRNYRK